jgi:hypothetical protein
MAKDFPNPAGIASSGPQGEGWFSIGRFSQISALDDSSREFLEMITLFMDKKRNDRVIEGIGFFMPNVGDLEVGFIEDLVFVADTQKQMYPDGLIFARKPTSITS